MEIPIKTLKVKAVQNFIITEVSVEILTQKFQKMTPSSLLVILLMNDLVISSYKI